MVRWAAFSNLMTRAKKAAKGVLNDDVSTPQKTSFYVLPFPFIYSHD